MEPLDTLVPEAGPGLPLPDSLRRLYGGPLDLPPGSVYSNFVSSLDGVVALGAPGVSSGGAISGRNEGDRFVMGLLRACASCVLIGAQTARDDSGHLWTPSYIHPPSAPSFAELRAALGLEPEPRLVVVTASGDVDPHEPAYEAGALILAPAAAAARLRTVMPSATEVAAVTAGDRVDAAAALSEIEARYPGGRVLTEGGPQIIGWLLRPRRLDTLFLTLSPVLAGRAAAYRPGFIAGLELLPEAGRWAKLASVRRAGDHLFLRYDLPPAN